MTDAEHDLKKPRKPACPKRRRMFGLFKAWLDAPYSLVRSGHLRQALDEHELQARLRHVLPEVSPVTPTTSGCTWGAALPSRADAT